MLKFFKRKMSRKKKSTKVLFKERVEGMMAELEAKPVQNQERKKETKKHKEEQESFAKDLEQLAHRKPTRNDETSDTLENVETGAQKCQQYQLPETERLSEKREEDTQFQRLLERKIQKQKDTLENLKLQRERIERRTENERQLILKNIRIPTKPSQHIEEATVDLIPEKLEDTETEEQSDTVSCVDSVTSEDLTISLNCCFIWEETLEESYRLTDPEQTQAVEVVAGSFEQKDTRTTLQHTLDSIFADLESSKEQLDQKQTVEPETPDDTDFARSLQLSLQDTDEFIEQFRQLFSENEVFPCVVLRVVRNIDVAERIRVLAASEVIGIAKQKTTLKFVLMKIACNEDL